MGLTKNIIQEVNFNELLGNFHARDIALFFTTLNDTEKEVFINKCEINILSETIPYLEYNKIKKYFFLLDLNKQINILNNMASDDEVDFLKKVDYRKRQILLKNLYDQEQINFLLKYTEKMTGAYMNYEMVKINQKADVKEATKSLIKMAPEVEEISSIFVIDDENKYVGVIALRTLIKTKSPMNIADIMDYIDPVIDTSNVDETANKMTNYKMYEMPVVDENNVLVGVVTHDDAMDILSASAKEDFEKLAALPTTTNESIFKTAIHRLPWLIILTILSIPIFFLTAIFEKPLAGISILVVLQPLMLGTPGNIATQTLAVSLQELNDTGKLNGRTIIKELFSGLYTAFFLAVISFIIAYLFMFINPPSYAPANTIIKTIYQFNNYVVSPAFVFASILALSLFIVIIIAPLLAIFIPLFLKLLRLDPAVASGPFITTVIDITAVGLYFTIALTMLQGIGVI